MPLTTPPAEPARAAAHFRARLALETDCADLHTALRAGEPVVVVDARSRAAFAAGHLPGATSIPWREIDEVALAPHGDALFVTYCWGPHCNAATRAAAAIAATGRPVKELLGGTWGWQEEGYELVAEEAP